MTGMAYDKKSFLAGIAVGRQLKGWAARADGVFVPGEPGTYVTVDFYTWAAANHANPVLRNADTYAEFISGLEFQGVTKTGSFVWEPAAEDILLTGTNAYFNFVLQYTYRTGIYSSKYSEVTVRGFPQVFSSLSMHAGKTSNSSPSTSGTVLKNADGSLRCLWHIIGSQPIPVGAGFRNVRLNPPVSGTYSKIASQFFEMTALAEDHTEHFHRGQYESEAPYFREHGNPFSIEYNSNKYYAGEEHGYYTQGVINVWLPRYYITPMYDEYTGSEMKIERRPTSIAGYYGTLSQGQVLRAGSGTLIKETTSTFYNPATGLLRTISDWRYNYTTRTYTLTISGDTVTVQFGDNTITITEGGTVYTLYYIVPAGYYAPSLLD